MKIRLIGDCHNKIDSYIKIASESKYSIQLGDLGFDYYKLSVLDSNRHKAVWGNHEDMRKVNGVFINKPPHILDDFGIIEKQPNSNIPDMFYVRGGISIDKAYRTEGKDWFPDEQLTYQQMCKAIALYEKVKPEIVLSHETPSSMIPYVANPNFAHLNLKPSATAQMLEEMLKIHQPKFHFHGHFHVDKCYKPDKTNFFCLDELSVIDLIDTEFGYDVISGYYNISVITPF